MNIAILKSIIYICIVKNNQIFTAMYKIENAIRGIETETLKFRPSNEFYQKIGIGKKRFWQVARGEKSGTIEELNKIAKVIGVEVNKLID